MNSLPEAISMPDRRLFVSPRDGMEDPYLLDLPAHPSEQLVLVVLLHGHGSGYDQYFQWELLRPLTMAFRERGWIGLYPHVRGNSWMAPHAAADLADLIEQVRREHAVRHVIISGGSMGGSAALAFAVVHPELTDGVVAICPACDIGGYYDFCVTAGTLPVHGEIAAAIAAAYGATPTELPDVFRRHAAIAQTDALRGKPVVVLHGARDAVIPVLQCRTLAAKLAGEPLFRYIEDPVGDHNSVLRIPEWVEFLEWTLEAR